MAYCVFTNCLAVLGSGITPYTSLDSRSGIGLTSNGQMAFFGSSDNSGPLGMVFQHINSFGVCRVDITATRYGISGNDLSLNVDSSDPDTAGGMYIKYRGNVGIGTSAPSTKLNIRHRIDRAYTPNSYNDTSHALHIEFCNQNQRAGLIRFTSHGNLENSFGVVQMGCSDGGTGCGQGDFVFQAYRTSPSPAYSELMRLTRLGNIGIGTTTPDSRLHICNAVNGGTDNYSIIIQNACTVADARAGIAFSNNSQTPSAGGLSGASIQTSNNGIDGTGNLLFGTLLNGTNTERMRITSVGNVGIGTSSPNIAGFTGAMLTINGAGNYQGLEIATSGTARITMLADSSGAFGYVSTRQTGMSLLFEAGAAQERMRITCCGNVGIGTSSPIDKLEVAGGIHTSGTAAASKACTGYLDYYIGQVRVGITGPNTTTPAVFRIDQYSSNASIICTPFYITATSNIGVNTTSPSYRLHVNGTFYAAGSSQDYKQGICNYNTDSCLFMCLKPKTYQYKDEWKHLGKDLKSETQIGLIAEEVAESHPELAILVNEEDNKVVRNVDYEKLSIILLSEVQKLRQEVDQLKNK